MTKWIIIILIIMLVPVVAGATDCQVSYDGNVTWRNITKVEDPIGEGSHFGIPQATLFCIRCKNDTTNYGYVCDRTREGSDTAMGSLSITLFLIGLVGAMYILPFRVQFVKSKPLNTIVKRTMWILATALLALATSMLATMADVANLGITQHMLTFVWIFHKSLYVLMILLFWSIFITVPRMYKEERVKKRMGDA